MNTAAPNLMFGAPRSSIEIGFWEELYSRKLDTLKLNSAKVTISAELSVGGSLDAQSILVNKDSFSKTSTGPVSSTPVGSISSSAQENIIRGSLWNVNTIEEFKDLDKRKCLEELGVEHIWNRAILREEAIENPALLFYFLLLTFADLKTYKFMYWYGAPAVIATSSTHEFESSRSLYDQRNCLYVQAAGSIAEPSSFVTRVLPGDVQPTYVERPSSVVHALYRGIYTLMRGPTATEVAGKFTYACLPPVFMAAVDNSGAVTVLTLEQGWGNRFLRNYFIIILDGSATPAFTTAGDTTAANASAGWGMRNLLALLAATVNSDAAMPLDADPEADFSQCQIVSLGGEILFKLMKLPTFTGDVSTAYPLVDRLVDNYLAEVGERESSGLSVVGSVSCVLQLKFTRNNELAQQFKEESTRGAKPVLVPVAYKVIGWETNERGKPGPKQIDMSSYLNPVQLLAQASNLNLKLMKWRLWENLDIDKIRETKCLLLGAGTLGCAVARVLLGWGVGTITFVDNGRVSYSNPTRQCLYTFEDCSARKFKATAAAEAIKAVNPSCNCTGVVLTIPMPGHAINAFEKADTETAHDDLVRLIREHDVIYLLTDSREARWLPSIIYASIPPTEAESKIMINVALGFDSYLVMRHGQALSADTNGADTTNAVGAFGTNNDVVSTKPRLGCYFCNDIIGVTNTLKDRTLDQQCTVTRPGLAYIASAWAVELMVALLHVDPGTRGQVAVGSDVMEAAGDKSATGTSAAVVAAMGEREIPHQIRGNLLSCTQMLPIVSLRSLCCFLIRDLCLLFYYLCCCQFAPSILFVVIFTVSFILAQSPAFNCCTACSSAVVNAYRRDGYQLCQQVASDPKHLENISGITTLTASIEEMENDCFLMEDDEY